jgi:hypothetical protein
MREKTQVNKIGDEKGNITTNTNEIKRIMREYYEILYSNKQENLKEMSKFLDAFDQTELNEEDINYLNRSTTSNEFETTKNSPGPDEFTISILPDI